MKALIGTALLLATLVTAGCSNTKSTTSQPLGPGHDSPQPINVDTAKSVRPMSRPEWVPKLTDVLQVRLQLGLPMPEEQAPQPLYPNHTRDKEVIVKLLTLLAEAEPVEGEIGPPARSPIVFIDDSDGNTVGARLAYDCTVTKTTNGTQQTCRQATGQVLVHAGGQSTRFRSARLADWLTSSWRQDVRIGGDYKDCGSENQRQANADSTAARDCLWQAYTTGELAKFTVTQITTEGDPIVSVVRVLASDLVEITHDNTKDKFASEKDRTVSTFTCRTMERVPLRVDSHQPYWSGHRFKFTGCDNPDKNGLTL